MDSSELERKPEILICGYIPGVGRKLISHSLASPSESTKNYILKTLQLPHAHDEYLKNHESVLWRYLSTSQMGHILAEYTYYYDEINARHSYDLAAVRLPPSVNINYPERLTALLAKIVDLINNEKEKYTGSVHKLEFKKYLPIYDNLGKSYAVFAPATSQYIFTLECDLTLDAARYLFVRQVFFSNDRYEFSEVMMGHGMTSENIKRSFPKADVKPINNISNTNAALVDRYSEIKPYYEISSTSASDFPMLPQSIPIVVPNEFDLTNKEIFEIIKTTWHYYISYKRKEKTYPDLRSVIPKINLENISFLICGLQQLHRSLSFNNQEENSETKQADFNESFHEFVGIFVTEAILHYR